MISHRAQKKGMKHAEQIIFLGHKPRKALSPHQGQSQPFG